MGKVLYRQLARLHAWVPHELRKGRPAGPKRPAAEVGSDEIFPAEPVLDRFGGNMGTENFCDLMCTPHYMAGVLREMRRKSAEETLETIKRPI